MITIRDYQESDARHVGILIADTYRDFNLSFVPPEEMGLFLGPFQHARSIDPEHQERIAAMIRSENSLCTSGGRPGRIKRLTCTNAYSGLPPAMR